MPATKAAPKKALRAKPTPRAQATKPTRARANPYSVHSGVAMVQKWIDEMEEKTGCSYEKWIRHIQARGPKDAKACREWLKEEHGFGSNTAGFLADKALGNEMGLAEDDPETYLALAPKYVDDQYAGKKAGLRPIYDRLLALGLSLGADVKACPCKTIVPLYREHVFAQIKATTNTRVDLGLALAKMPESKIPKRVIDTGGKAKKDRITHRIEIERVDEIDEFVEKWLRAAYELDAPR